MKIKGTLMSALNHNGAVVGMSTTRKTNGIYDLTNQRTICEWRGAEVTSCTTYGDAIACAALDGWLFIIRDGKVDKLQFSKKREWIEGICAISKDDVLVGGEGRVYRVNISNGKSKALPFRKFGIRRRNRMVCDLVGGHGVVYVLGKHALLLKYSDDTLVDCLDGTQEEHLMFTEGVFTHRALWLVGFDLPNVFCAKYTYSNGRFTQYEIPFKEMSTPAIISLGNELLLGSREIYLGTPGSWRLIGDFEEATLINFVPVGNRVFGVGYTGKVMEIGKNLLKKP